MLQTPQNVIGKGNNFNSLFVFPGVVPGQEPPWQPPPCALACCSVAPGERGLLLQGMVL